MILKKKLGESVISKKNTLPYQYLEDNLIEDK